MLTKNLILILNILIADFVISSDQLRSLISHRFRRAAIAKKERLWTDGIIPYEIDPQFSGAHKALFVNAMRHWENYTCVTFIERTRSQHPDFIYFTIRQCGCCSFVGRQGGGGQTISIGRNCDKFGIVVHELGHVIGLWHEHTRPDRDDHVIIDKENIINGHQNNFNKLTDSDVDSLGLAYDFHSIMHYAQNTFSKIAYKDTIFPKDENQTKRSELGQRIKLSSGDIEQVNLLYNCPKCGQNLQNNSGVFGVSNPNADFCVWKIIATYGERIALTINHLNIEQLNNCELEYLEIRDGYWDKSPLLHKFCGQEILNQIIWSTGNRLHITLKLNDQSENRNDRQLAASYRAVCGGNLYIRDIDRLESPNYPMGYLPNKECAWILTVRKGGKVAIKFQSFDLEYHEKCNYDYVEIHDGSSANGTFLGRFCGQEIPPVIESKTNQIHIKFASDKSAEKVGFSAIIIKEVDECALGSHGCEQECVNTIGSYRCACSLGYSLHSDQKSCENACGGKITDANGTLTSPEFPDVYPKSKYCIWEIEALPGQKIILNFTHFDLEDSRYRRQDCNFDTVRIYSILTDGFVHEYGTYCGFRLPPTIMSVDNKLRVEFRSDETIQLSGFNATFSTEVDDCLVQNGGCSHFCHKSVGSFKCSCENGFVLQADGKKCLKGDCHNRIIKPEGEISSPNFPMQYPNNTNCIWLLSTLSGHRIELLFSTFDLEPHQECAFDHLTVYNGLTPMSFTLGRFCGSSIPDPIIGTKNHMRIEFKADNTGQRTGFLAQFTSICGGVLVATDEPKKIYSHSHFGGKLYENNVNCQWTIEAENEDQSVQLNFDSFDVEDHGNCSYDFVEIVDGYKDQKLGKYCGSKVPQTIESSFETILIRFRTDSSVVFQGFSISFVAIDRIEESSDTNREYDENVKL